MKSSAILLMAGSGTRTHLTYNKTLYEINNVPLFMYSLNKLTQVGFDEYIIVVSNSDYEYVCNYLASTPYHVKIVLGGLTRSESVKNAIKEVSTDVALIHDAARPLISTRDIDAIIEETIIHGAVCPVSKANERLLARASICASVSLSSVATPQRKLPPVSLLASITVRKLCSSE